MPRKSTARRSAILAVITLLLMAAVIGISALVLFDDAHDRYHGGGAKWAVRTIAQRVYENPTPSRIDEIAEHSSVRIRYRGPGGEHATDNHLPEFEEAQSRARKRRGGMMIAHTKEGWVVLHRKGEHKLMIALGDEYDLWSAVGSTLIFLILSLSLLWACFYFAQWRLLSPLGKLRNDMEAAGRGEWRETNIVRDDDIGELASVFNRMQKRLRDLLAAKERFLADASHELRTPLARIKLAAEMVADEKLRARLAADIVELESLTGGILERARLETVGEQTKKKPLAVPFLFESLRRRYGNVDFNCDGEITVLADMQSLERAVSNLLDNAVKFAASKVRAECKTEHAQAVITVRDDGPGVPEDDLPHLFEPFYRADISRTRDTGGYGLGLAIVRATAKAHNGKVTAKNQNGLLVELRLPLYN